MEVHGRKSLPSGGAAFQLDTVRALHQTVVSLRAALEASKLELDNLRQKYESHVDPNIYSDTIEKLTLENHILRRRLLIETEASSDKDLSKPISSAEQQLKNVTFDEKFDSKITNIIEETSETKDIEDLNKFKEISDISVEAIEVSDTVLSDTGRGDEEVINVRIISDENFNSIETCESKSDNDSLVTVRENKKELTKKIRFSDDEILNDENLDKGVTNNEDTVDETTETFNNQQNTEYETTIELESKFDVTIKVLATRDKINLIPLEIKTDNLDKFNIKTDEINSNKLNENDSDKKNDKEPIDGSIKPLQIFITSNEELDMAGLSESNNTINKTTDKFNIQLKITSKDNLTMDQSNEPENTSENLNVDADEVSARSVSEGDNSVFSEAGITVTGNTGDGRRVCEQDSISGNDSEEVDDIELIFTTDETKEFSGYQEDLVSITEGENWVHADTSTPVLLKFNLLESEERQIKLSNINSELSGNQKLYKKNTREQSTTTYTDSELNQCVKESESFDKIDSEQNKYKKGYLRSSRTFTDSSDAKEEKKNIDSTDSLTYDNQKSYSFDNTKSSIDSSVDIITRELSFDQKDESLDQLNSLRMVSRKKYSVCVETDISKCGVMEDDTFPGNLNARRNTCPNPFQYRPLSHRDAVKGLPIRPLLGHGAQKGPRKSSAAQTDISALPNHWRSDTHLAKKILPQGSTTLPSKVVNKTTNYTRLIPPSPARPAHLSEENRRVLLSDIGFTSMVPELSRSAEPIWGVFGNTQLSPSTSVTHIPLCCALHAAPYYGSVPSSPTRQDSSNTTSKYWSRSSMQRSTSGKMGDTTPGSHRVSFIDQPSRKEWRGSMPELRKSVPCCSRSKHRFHKLGYFSEASRSRTVEGADSGDSTEELLEEADNFLRRSVDLVTLSSSKNTQDDYSSTNYIRPYLPTTPRQLRLGHLVKIIAPHGRIALGKVRYVGIAGGPSKSGAAVTTYVGVQLKTRTSSGSDGTFHGRRYFHCEPGCSVFVPFSKVVVAWADT